MAADRKAPAVTPQPQRDLPQARRLSLMTLAALPILLSACSSLPGIGTSSTAGSPTVAGPAPAAPAWVPAPPPPAGKGIGGEVVALPPLRERLRLLALQEWALWGRVRFNASADLYEEQAGLLRHRESEPAYAARVLGYWFAFKGRDASERRIQYPDGSLLPWSGAFISSMMRMSGVPDEQFAAHEQHWHYIRAAMEAGGRPGFEALDAAGTAPRPGDLICAPRDPPADAPRDFAQWRAAARGGRAQSWAWHCDLVVDVDPAAGEVGAVGGNVGDTVAWTRTPMGAGGLLLPTATRPWTVVLRHNGR